MNAQISDQGLHALYKLCPHPLNIVAETRRLIGESEHPQVYVNTPDHRGDTPLGLLVLHANRGLRYHRFKLPELQSLEDNYAPAAVIDAKCVEIDAIYQNGVYQCLQLLLEHGADCNHIGGSCSAVASDVEWSDGYETKIMQSESRWNLLGLGASMKYSKYNNFDPIINFKVVNTSIMPLHLVAWRGSSKFLKLLIDNGAQINARSIDGRNALHFLYHYCNRPSDLVKCTEMLLKHGIDVHAADQNDVTPLVLLLYHIFVKRSHVRHLACQALSEYNVASPENDHFREEIMATLKLLLQGGAAINKANKDGETPLHVIFKRFQRSLKNCDEDFQELRHDIVPYTFSVQPLLLFSKFLIEHGAEVGATDHHGNTALHKLTSALQGLSLSQNLNPAADITECFSLLLKHGVKANAQGSMLKTAGHLLLESIMLRGAGAAKLAFERYHPVLELLLHYGWDVNLQDQSGNSPLSMLFVRSAAHRETLALLLFLLRAGADPIQRSRSGKVPLKLLLETHVLHHDPVRHGNVNHAHGNVGNVHGNFGNVHGNFGNVHGMVGNVQGNFGNVHGNVFNVHGYAGNFHGNGPNLHGIFPNVHGNGAVVHANAPGATDNAQDDTETNAESSEIPNREIAPFLSAMRALCLAMPQQHVDIVFCAYRQSGLCGVICKPECPVYKLLEEQSTQVRNLAHLCRIIVWHAMKKRFYTGCELLPLPPGIKKYVFDLTS